MFGRLVCSSLMSLSALWAHCVLGATTQSEDDLECGRRCLVIWLGLHDVPASSTTVESCVPVGHAGSSLYQLQTASQKLGLPSQVVDFGGSGIAALPLPCIVHVQLADREFGGHFVVLVNCVDDIVFVIDPNMPKVVTMSEADLASIATGYALISRDDLGSGLTPLNLLVATSVLVSILLLVRVLWGRAGNRRWVRMALPICLLPICLLPICLLSVGCDGPENEVVEYEKPSTEHSTTTHQQEETQPASLSWDQSAKDFGLVEQHEVTVEYLLENITSDPLAIVLGNVSCACLDASLSRKELMPGEKVVLTLVLSYGGLPGERSGSVAVGVVGSEESHVFSARAVFEGVSGHDVVSRLEAGTPAKGELLVGRIVAGPSVIAEDIFLDNIEWSKADKPNVSFSNFVVHEVQRNKVFSEFQYKVTVSPGPDIENGAYYFRMNLLVSAKIRSFEGKLLVLTKAKPGGQE